MWRLTRNALCYYVIIFILLPDILYSPDAVNNDVIQSWPLSSVEVMASSKLISPGLSEVAVLQLFTINCLRSGAE